MTQVHCYYCDKLMDDEDERGQEDDSNECYTIYIQEVGDEQDVCGACVNEHFPNAGTDIFLWPKTDKDGDEIYWGYCIACGERTHHKVKEVTKREMIPGETYYYMHQQCAEKGRKR